jgi:hypothetical protein
VYATALCPAISGKPLWVVLQTGVQGNQGLCAGKSRTIDRALRLAAEELDSVKLLALTQEIASLLEEKAQRLKGKHPEH